MEMSPNPSSIVKKSLEAPRPIKDPRIIARKYQLELCERAVKENIIVCLETGCGKTHIAVLLMYELGHLIRNPSQKICIFLAPTVPLVRQQAMVIEDSTDFKISCHCGNQKNLKDHNEWNKEIEQAEVLVMTPEILLYSLRHCFIRMETVALLIFDECHHAQAHKRHPYAQIMQEFYETGCAKSPRIFGMTASPIIGKGGTNQLNYSKCINSLENLLDAKVCTVVDKSELESVVTSPHITLYFYGPVIQTSSSFTVSYCKKLEEIKLQCISMIKEELCDFSERDKKMKLLFKLHDNIIFCVEQMGLVGAVRAAHLLASSDGVDMPRLNSVRIDDNCFLDEYLKAVSVINRDLLDDNCDADSLPFEAIEDPLYSKKLSTLISILASYRLQDTTKCIIFVKRIIVAKSLAYILERLQSLEFWKCEFLVGCHSGPRSMSRRKMNVILEKFSSGEVNLLVATNVAEEGLDIQTCCLVVRFDLPETVASFIQSRGRARMPASKFVFLLERGNEREQKLLNDFMAGELIMNEEITSRSSSETFDDLEQTVYKVDKTGASISTCSSVSLLHHYCDKLSKDKYFTPLPKFYFLDDLGGTICRIILPPNSTIRQVESLPCTSKEEAKRHACLIACKELHKRGALTDYLLPDRTGGKKIGPGIHLSQYNSNSNGEETSRDLHEMLVPAVFRSSWNYNDANMIVYFYHVVFAPQPKDRQYRTFGLFTKNPLPEEAESFELDLHLTHGRIVKTKLIYLGMLTFDKEDMMLAQNFQEMCLKIILDRSEFFSDFIPLGACNAAQDCSTKFYLLLPVTGKLYEGKKMIDWATVRRCLSSPAFTKMTYAFDKVPYCTSETIQLLNGSVNKSDVLYSLVFTPHNNLFFFVDGILYDTNANSRYKSTSYAEYYQNRFRIQLSYPEQPFLKAKQLFVLRNLLHNRIQEKTEARDIAEHFVELPPELCSLKIIGFSKDIGSSLSLLPSVMHRLENLLVAIELKDALSSSFPEASDIGAHSILEALTTEKCLERLSLERFEVLGDSFLKYAVGRHCFLSFEALDEGQLTQKRSGFVNNLNLYELAIAKKLQVYIRDELFDPAQFFALGRPCKTVCNIDTKSMIHQPEENLNVGVESCNVKCTKSHHWVYRKTVADVVEALVGAFLVESGFKAAFAFLRWIGVPVDFNVSDVYKVLDLSKRNLSLLNKINVNELEERLDRPFLYKGLLLEALIHPSYNNHFCGCYQKLEFLGDAILDYLITSYLYSVYPELKPGQITDLRSMAVNNDSFANIAVRASLHKYLIKDSKSLTEAISNFERFVYLSDPEKDLVEEPACPKVLGDVVESSIGAVLLDSGFDLTVVWNLMLTLLEPVLDFSSLKINPMREVRELCQYFNFDLQFPDPIKISEGYLVKVEIVVKDEAFVFKSTNVNSKAARRTAALDALSSLKARGYKHKSKSPEEIEKIVLEAKKGKPELIGFDEEPIRLGDIDKIPFEKLEIQVMEEIPQSAILEVASDAFLSNCNGSSCSYRVDSTRAMVNEYDQTHESMTYNSMVNETSPSGNNREKIGNLASKTAKSQLMEICTANCWSPPSFKCCKDEGPSHLKMFTYKVVVEVEGLTCVRLECYSEPRAQKKAAENHAAEGALWYLKNHAENHAAEGP